MIAKLIVSNYRSIGQDVEIPLGSLCALVGVNAAGKSSIIDVLRFLGECARDGLGKALERRGGLGSLRRRGVKGRSVVIRAEFVQPAPEPAVGFWEFGLDEDAGGDFLVTHEYSDWETPQIASGIPRPRSFVPLRIDRGKGLRISPSLFEANKIGVWSTSELHLDLEHPLRKNLHLICYDIHPSLLRPPQRPDSQRRPMDEHGANWTSALRRLPKETAGQELLAALGRITGDITDYRVNAVGGYLVAEFCHGGDQWLDASQESDGTLRMAGLLTALLQDPSLSLIGIEEPELTVHPGALPVLYDFIRDAGQRSQVVLSTHSPDLLDMLDVDQIRVVTRDSTTHVSLLAADQREAVKQHLLSTSDLLRAEGLRPELPPAQSAQEPSMGETPGLQGAEDPQHG